MVNGSPINWHNLYAALNETERFRELVYYEVIDGSVSDQAFEEVRKQVITYVGYYYVQPPFERVVTSDGVGTNKSQCFRNDICG